MYIFGKYNLKFAPTDSAAAGAEMRGGAAEDATFFTHFLTHKSTLLSTKPKAQNAQSWRVLYKRAHITYCIRHVSYNFPSGKYTNDFKSYFLDGFQVFISPILLDRDAYAFNARARSSPHDSPGRRRDVDLHLDKRLGAA